MFKKTILTTLVVLLMVALIPNYQTSATNNVAKVATYRGYGGTMGYEYVQSSDNKTTQYITQTTTGRVASFTSTGNTPKLYYAPVIIATLRNESGSMADVFQIAHDNGITCIVTIANSRDGLGKFCYTGDLKSPGATKVSRYDYYDERGNLWSDFTLETREAVCKITIPETRNSVSQVCKRK